jgi:hypothetical protein
MVVFLRQQSLQRHVNVSPRTHDALELEPMDDASFPVEADARPHPNSDRAIDGNADTPHDCEHFVVRADACAAQYEIVARTFEYVDV